MGNMAFSLTAIALTVIDPHFKTDLTLCFVNDYQPQKDVYSFLYGVEEMYVLKLILRGVIHVINHSVECCKLSFVKYIQRIEVVL